MKAAQTLVKPNACVLVVDDERRNRELLEVMLVADGYRVSLASSGQEALHLVAASPPDLILLDVMMAGMDGYQVATALKGSAKTAHIPIIMVTALSNRKSRILGLGAGAEEFLTKPVDRAELSLRVRSLLRLKAYADQYDHYSQALEKEVANRTRELNERTEILEQKTQLLIEQAALLDLAQDAIMVQDLEGRVRFWNPGAVAMYGWSREEALGRSSSELLQEESTTSDQEREAELLMRDHWEGEVVRRHRDGRRIDVTNRLTLQRDRNRNPVQVLSLDTDITGRKQAELERKALTERLSLATAVAQVGVWEWERSGNSLTWDATMFDLYGLPPLCPLPYDVWAAAIFPEDRAAVEAVRRKVIDDKGSGSAEFRITRPDGAMRDISAIEKAVLDGSGSVVRVVGVNHDVTEQRAAEKALAKLREDEMRFKDDFLSHVSHELRSPLTAIKQFTSILRSGLAGDLNAEQHQYQAIVIKNVHQLQSMINDLLEVTRLETGKLILQFGSVDIATVVEAALETLQVTARSKCVSLSGALQGLPPVYADETRLLQILTILLDNAVKYTPAGGEILVRGGRLQADPGFLLVEVSDTGCGIESGISEKLFERLYQAPEEGKSSRNGLGLGLYICKELVLRHGGEIWVKSEPGSGSTFSFTLPLYSLDQLIAPLIKSGRWPADQCALLTVRLHQPEANSAHPPGIWAQEIQNLVLRCLLPDLHLLLPVRRNIRGEAFFFVAVYADDHGMSVLATKILTQFRSSRSLNQSGRSLSLSHVLLPPFEREVQSADRAAATMAAALDAAIDARMLEAANQVKHEAAAPNAFSLPAPIAAEAVQVASGRDDGQYGTPRS